MVLASGRVERRLDYDALGQFLAWEYVPGEATLLRAVRRLKPASTLELDLQSGAVAIRGTGTRCAFTGVEQEAGCRVGGRARRHDRACVRNQLVSDVPLGAFLSGGVDSSLVVAAMGARRPSASASTIRATTRWRGRRASPKHLGVYHRVEIIRPQARELFDI